MSFTRCKLSSKAQGVGRSEISNSHLKVKVERGSCIFTPSCLEGFTQYKDRALKVKEQIKVDMHKRRWGSKGGRSWL
jgi:hypothetical protein